MTTGSGCVRNGRLPASGGRAGREGLGSHGPLQGLDGSCRHDPALLIDLEELNACAVAVFFIGRHGVDDPAFQFYEIVFQPDGNQDGPAFGDGTIGLQEESPFTKVRI